MAMTLNALIRLVPETQEVVIFDGEFQLQGSCDTLICWLRDDVLGFEVDNIEAEDGLLKIWLKG